MLTRVTDAARLDPILRHPRVLPWVAHAGQVPDLSALLADPRHVCLMNEHGGFLFLQESSEMYDAHVMFVPAGRGRHNVELSKWACSYIFKRTSALAISCTVEQSNAAALRLVNRVGFVPLRESAALGTPAIEYLLTVKQWVVHEP